MGEEKLVQFIGYSAFNQRPSGPVLIKPSAVEAVVEIECRGCVTSKIRVSGEWIEIYEESAVVRRRLGI